MNGRDGWQTVDFDYPAGIPTMLTGEERRYLFWLASDLWDGSGHIVEVGTWLGGSTYCLAAGMRANRRREPWSRLHCLDNFRWRAFMADRAPLDLAPGASFRSAFEQNLREYIDFVTVHESRLPDDDSGDIQFAEPTRGGDEELPLVRGEWIGAPVAVLFEDGAKSWGALVHLLREVLPHCRPGALLVLQDYKDWASYWVAMAVARLCEAVPGALRLRHVLPENTVTFEVVKRVEASALGILEPALADVDVAEGLRLLERGASVLDRHGDDPGAAVVRLSGTFFLGAKGDWERALERFRNVERTWPRAADLGVLERARSSLGRNVGRAPRPSVRTLARRAAGSLARRL